MRKNRMKEKLKAGEAVIGVFNNLQAPSVVEIMAIMGMDFVIVDAEHTSITPETAENLYRAAEVRDITPVTRIGENSQQVIQKFLDAGSQGVLIPMVNTGADARRVVDATKYPPVGKRGLAGTRSASWGLVGSTAEYVKQANEEMLVAVQVETLQAVEGYKDILAVDEIDVLFFGPADISSSMGYPGQAKHPEVLSLIDKLNEQALAAGKATGTIARDLDDFIYFRQRGFQWLCSGTSNMLAAGAQHYAGRIKEWISSQGG